MTRTRWKLAAGALAVSFGGLAAVADMPGGTEKLVPRVGAPVEKQSPLLLPPEPANVPLVPVPMIVTAAEPPAPAACPNCPVANRMTAEVAPRPRPAAETKVTVTELTLPVLAEPVATAVPVVPVVAAESVPLIPAPASAIAPVAVGPVVAAESAPPAAAITPAPAVTVAPTPVPAPAVTPATEKVAPVPAAEPPALAAATEKKLKVMLHMGEDRPWFEVRDGNEVYLKVVCDSVDVKSPAQRGDAPSVMRATGKVLFVTPGGEGLCEELTVTPGTGQVAVTGKVAFTYNWGKTETTVSGDKMTFRLGAAPGASSAAAPATVPASYQRPVR